MLSTPKHSRFRPSLGEPSRVRRAASPGASSVGSEENSPRGRRGACGSLIAATTVRSRPTSVRHSRDPRPVGDRGYATQCARNVVDVLAAYGYSKSISHDKLLKDPSTKEFFDIFRFFVSQIDPALSVDGKMEDEVPAIMRRLKYPVEVNRSKLQAISGPNTWPQLLAVLDWLAHLVQMNLQFVEPIATCHMSLDGDGNGEDHIVFRTLHESYMGFLGGKENHEGQEKLRHIYEDKIYSIRGEIDRLENHKVDMEEKVQHFHAEHERFLELQKVPMQMEIEAERLRSTIQSQEAKVTRLEHELAVEEAEEHQQLREVEELQRHRVQLAAQVEGQAYSKRDIEHRKCERGHLRQALRNLQDENGQADHDVWQHGMQEREVGDEIDRIVRQANETGENLGEDLRLRVDLHEPCDALAALDFEENRSRALQALAQRQAKQQSSEHELRGILDQQRQVQERLSLEERDLHHLLVRRDQLERMREESIATFEQELDQVRLQLENTEDAVRQACPSAAASMSEAAECDRLRLVFKEFEAQGLVEENRLSNEIRRDSELFAERSANMSKELERYAKDMERIAADVEQLVSPYAHGGC